MEAILSQIIDDDGLCSIDVELLEKYTKRVDPHKIGEIHWDKVRHLHIYGRGSFTSLGHEPILCGTYVSLDGTWVLGYWDITQQAQKVVSLCGNSLVSLDIRNALLSSLNVSEFTQLREFIYIDFYVRDKICWIEGLSNCLPLEKLNLFGAVPQTILDVSGMTGLKYLRIIGSERSKISKHYISGFCELRELEYLVLSGLFSGKILDVSELTKLKVLYLVSNTDLQTITGISYLRELERLSLRKTGITAVPEEIRKLKKLNSLILSQLTLDTLPEWIPELELPISVTNSGRGIELRNTLVKDMDMSVLDRSQELIFQWFEDRKRGDEIPLNEIKVVFLGNGEVGKSHTIARLLNNGEEPSESFTGSATPGIAIENKEYDIDGRKVQVHFWDFGGQDILYSMHRMFLTKRTLYVILVDARNESKGNQAREWLDTVKSFAEDAPVLLVVNKTDQNPTASIDEETLRRKYNNLKKVVYMSALTATKDEFTSKFTDSMLEMIRQSGSLEIKWPKKWTQVKAGLQNMQEPYIFGEAYERLCQECNVSENQISLLEWFNDLGISFCQCQDYRLRNYVILRPDWMTNAIYTILFNKREEVENGMISLEEIDRLLNPTPENKDKIHKVISDTTYTWTETNYVLDVVRKFRLSYSVNRDMEFFPMLCKENSKPVAQEYADSETTLEFLMKFEYLPNNVLHRLMVERWTELDTENVWLTGARFIQPNTGLSAVVRIDGNVLQIYVRSENNLHSRNTYLSVIEGSVGQIRQELKLPKPKSRLVYKLGDRRAEFDYERLLKMHAKGKETEYSDELDDDFPILDILNQFAPDEVTEQERLLSDLVKACSQLQAEKHYWGTKENPRNSYIRNALDNMGYVLRDQTLRGISGGETEEGELDLDIRKYKDVPWTICEALRVDSGSKTDWNFHLKKLLDNYNPNGVRFLVLLTYVDDEKDKFDQIWNSFKNHTQGHDEGSFAYQLNSFKHYQTESWTGNHYIQTATCKYILGEYTPTVYHIFVRMGR